jgi:hypothetical protein
MRYIPIALIATSLLLPACTSAPRVAVTYPLTMEEVAWSVKEGNNTITGNVTFTSPDGTVRTCYSYGAYIRADTPYARERIQHLYGNLESGYRAHGIVPRFEPNTPIYKQTTRWAPCDANGNFIFTKLPSGKWFLTAPLREREVGYRTYEGEYVMKHVTTSGGRTQHVTLGN